MREPRNTRNTRKQECQKNPSVYFVSFVCFVVKNSAMAALQLFLIGAPRCGKSTVFQALTNTPEGQHSFTKGAHHLGTVKVPELSTTLRELEDGGARLEHIHDY